MKDSSALKASTKHYKHNKVAEDTLSYPIPSAIYPSNKELFQNKLSISGLRTCQCNNGKLNCMTAKEWIRSQLGVWQFFYEKRDIRDKTVHPATFPISLCKKIIQLFTHQGEIVLAPFVGSGTTLLAAKDLNRNAVGFDLQAKYIQL